MIFNFFDIMDLSMFVLESLFPLAFWSVPAFGGPLGPHLSLGLFQVWASSAFLGLVHLGLALVG